MKPKFTCFSISTLLVLFSSAHSAEFLPTDDQIASELELSEYDDTLTRNPDPKKFSNVIVKRNLKSNTLQVTNGATIGGGLAVAGTLMANGTVVGAAGPAGPAGANGVSQYGYVTNIARNIQEDIATGTPFTFRYTTTPPSSGGITVPTTGNSIFTVTNAGTYLIQYTVIGKNPIAGNIPQAALKIVGGAAIANSTYCGPTGDAGAAGQIVGYTIVTLTAGQQFQLINTSAQQFNLVGDNSLNNIAVNASVLFLKLA